MAAKEEERERQRGEESKSKRMLQKETINLATEETMNKQVMNMEPVPYLCLPGACLTPHKPQQQNSSCGT